MEQRVSIWSPSTQVTHHTYNCVRNDNEKSKDQEINAETVEVEMDTGDEAVTEIDEELKKLWSANPTQKIEEETFMTNWKKYEKKTDWPQKLFVPLRKKDGTLLIDEMVGNKFKTGAWIVWFETILKNFKNGGKPPRYLEISLTMPILVCPLPNASELVARFSADWLAKRVQDVENMKRGDGAEWHIGFQAIAPSLNSDYMPVSNSEVF